MDSGHGRPVEDRRTRVAGRQRQVVQKVVIVLLVQVAEKAALLGKRLGGVGQLTQVHRVAGGNQRVVLLQAPAPAERQRRQARLWGRQLDPQHRRVKSDNLIGPPAVIGMKGYRCYWIRVARARKVHAQRCGEPEYSSTTCPQVTRDSGPASQACPSTTSRSPSIRTTCAEARPILSCGSGIALVIPEIAASTAHP